MKDFLLHGGRLAWGLIGAVILTFALSTVLLADTANIRYRRDITRMVFNKNEGLLDDVRKQIGASTDSLSAQLAGSPEVPIDRPYLVVSIEERRLWFKQGERTLFETQIATGSGKTLENEGGKAWKFETPRGRLVIQSKETDPAWVPPDWHFVEQAKKKGLGIIKLTRGQSIPVPDGSVVTVVGNEVVKQFPDGSQVPFEVEDGREIVLNGNIVIPPFGTTQRKYLKVLGTHRLNMGDGYALHGTNKPESIGQAVSHGCVRLRNEDIETLYRLVPTGTPVYIY